MNKEILKLPLIIILLSYLFASTIFVVADVNYYKENDKKTCATSTVTVTQTCIVTPTPVLSCPDDYGKKNDHDHDGDCDNKHVTCTLTQTVCVTPTL